MKTKRQDSKPIRILVADDDLQILAILQQLLQPEFDIVATVSDGHMLVEAALRLRPDVIVTDISMPIITGFEALRRIRSAMPEIKCIFVTMHTTESYRLEAQRLGATGYVLKSLIAKELSNEIRRVMETCS